MLGGDTPFYSLVYPALAGLPLSFANAHTGYTALKAVQAVVMSLTAVPVYLWGRTLMRPRWALAAAALTLAVPGLAYSGQVMTEAAFYPVFVLAAWAAAAALARPTPRRQALLLGAVALAVGDAAAGARARARRCRPRSCSSWRSTGSCAGRGRSSRSPWSPPPS